MIKYFMLLRHAKAQKNVEHKHGGIGSGLVNEGIEQVYTLSKSIISSKIDFKYILFSDKPQCVQTALKLSEILKIPSYPINDLNPINLGILDGLSEEEALMNYPEYSELMSRWRNHEIEINELAIPGMTNYKVFYKAGIEFANKLKQYDSCIVVVTRSNLVQLGNILLGNSIEVGGNYKEITWANAGMLTFSYNEQAFNIYDNLTNVHLNGDTKRNRNY